MRRKMDGWPKRDTKYGRDKRETRRADGGTALIRFSARGRVRAWARDESHYPKAAAAAKSGRKASIISQGAVRAGEQASGG